MNEAERTGLWAEYSKNPSQELRESLILEYAGLVKIVAGRLNMYLGYAVEMDDLVGYGIFGLIDAIDKFDSLKGVKFETYASLRIRGAILDQIRKMDWIPRTLRQKQKKLDSAVMKIESETGRAATEEEIAMELDISVEETISWQNQTKIASLVSLDEYIEQGSEIKNDGEVKSVQFEQPEKVVERQELKAQLAKALEDLTENERKVIVFYYFEELTLKEISKILEVSDSRISQLHTKALQKMRKKMEGHMDLFQF